jgi:single-strand DNA-binding protein
MSNITLQGLVATTPRHIITQEGLPITSFRLAEYDNTDPNATTNWFTITGFRDLAINTASSVSKGDRVVVSGSLRIRDWDNGERSGTSAEVEAVSIGHDLCWGTSEFQRANPFVEEPKHECSCDNCPNKKETE